MPRAPRRLVLRRLVADAIDIAAGCCLAFLASLTSVGWFFATRAVVMLRIGQPDTVWRGPIPMLMGIAGTFVYSLPMAMLLVQVCEPLFGRGPGKRLMALKIVAKDGAALPSSQAWVRSAIKSSPWWLWTLGLFAGSWILGVAGGVAALLMLSDALLGMLLGSRPVWDAWTGTRIDRG